jgi:hypothetical protein
MSGKILSGSEIIEQRKKKLNQIGSTVSKPQVSPDAGINILTSRGKPYNNASDFDTLKLQNQMDTIRQRRNDFMKKAAPSQTMSAIPKPTMPKYTAPTTTMNPINNTIAKNIPQYNNNSDNAVIKPASSGDKFRFALGDIGEKVKSFLYGLGMGAGGRTISNVLEADINRTIKKRNGGTYPVIYSPNVDEDLIKKSFIGMKLDQTPDKADQIAEVGVFVILRDIEVWDVRSTDLQGFVSMPSMNKRAISKEYLFPNFLAQCCCDAGVNGIVYESVKDPKGSNLALLNYIKDRTVTLYEVITSVRSPADNPRKKLRDRGDWESHVDPTDVF